MQSFYGANIPDGQLANVQREIDSFAKLANATKANIALTAIEHYRLTKSLDELQSEPLCYVLICLKNIYAQAREEADAIIIPEINKQEIEAIDAAFDGKIKRSKPATIHLLKL